MTTEPQIVLYTNQTPNGLKITSTLEELNLQYKIHTINILENTQKEQWFIEKLNPNGRIPAMMDTFNDGEPIRLFETGAIQQYLVSKYDSDHKISYEHGTREDAEVNCWLFFLNAGIGPMQGQLTHFRLYAPEEVPYAIFRYKAECVRLYNVLNNHFANETSGSYLVGEKCTIADLAIYPWIACSAWSGLEIETFPYLELWKGRMERRPAIQKARQIPSPYRFEEIASDQNAAKAYAEPGRKWFQGLIADQVNRLSAASET